MRCVESWVVAFALSAALAQGASATTVRGLSTAELVAASDLVVTARCSGKESRWFGRDLLTLASFEVGETLKGSSPTVVTVLLPGGIDTSHVPPVQVIYAGAPTVEVGGEELLFLTPASSVAGAYVVTGFSQGLFDFAPGGVAGRHLAELTLTSADGTLSAGHDEALPAQDFLALIRALIAAEAEGGR